MHGYDITVPSRENQLDCSWKKFQDRFESKHRGRLGPSDGDQKQNRILNRIVEWSKQGIQYEGDQRHADICMNEVGILGASREVNTPVDRNLKLEKEPGILDLWLPPGTEVS